MNQGLHRYGRALAQNLLAWLAFVVVTLTAMVLYPSMHYNPALGNEMSTEHTVRLIRQAEVNYHAKKGRYGSLSELRAQKLIPAALSDAETSGQAFAGYHLALRVSGSGQSYSFLAVPLSSAGFRQFYVDDSGLIQANTDLSERAPSAGKAERSHWIALSSQGLPGSPALAAAPGSRALPLAPR